MSKIEKSMERRSIEDWLTESLRLTIFPGIEEQIQEQTWWHDLLQEEPSDINIQQKTGHRQEEGLYEDRRLVLSIQQERIDWRFTLPKENPRVGQVPNIGPFIECISEFSGLMLRWLDLESCPSTVRLALGVILVTPVEDRQEGYQQLSAYLPFDINTENASDFIYQINRPRFSTSVPNVWINRLSKWSVSTIFWMKSKFFMGTASATHLPCPQTFSCRLELDVNTVLVPELELKKHQLPKLFLEFIELGKEIVQEGDVP